ncbi:MAG: OmpA family protein [Chitinivibrionales bacterium]|nr:OmpA family protein [Chitinivibrionales bacterium]
MSRGALISGAILCFVLGLGDIIALNVWLYPQIARELFGVAPVASQKNARKPFLFDDFLSTPSDPTGRSFSSQSAPARDLSLANQLIAGSDSAESAARKLRKITFTYAQNSTLLSMRQAEKLETAVRKYQRAGTQLSLKIAGHADRRGESANAWELSQERTHNAQKLLRSYGVPEARIKAVAIGESQPLATSDDPEELNKNRRIEVTFYKGTL